MKPFRVPEHEAGERLDAYLAQRFPERSRSFFQKLAKAGGATVNGKPSKPHYAVRAGDEIAIISLDVVPGDAASGDAPKIRVLDETPDFFVIEKPSGLLVHPAPSQKAATLVDQLLALDPKIAKVGDAPERPGIVHRLDREASGLMVVARTKKMFEHLKKQFQAHAVRKAYLALVFGKISKDADTITTAIGRKKGKGRMSARSKTLEGDKDAVSHYDVLERFPHATLVKVRTETGRMHQVRVHMKSLGHPLVGDDLYAGANRTSPSLDRCPRLFLHAVALGFADLEGNDRDYQANLPEDLHAFLQSLKKKHGKS